ncbi:MAG TPA: hypothetical protein VKD65_09395 [Candidatus Angelobacter sp.]|nr:hypothetical protein [Candidatus Angelobacter sp.]
MRRIPLCAFLLMASLFAAQGAALPGDSTPRPGQVRGVTLSGQVSNNGKMLVTDDDNNWTVSNAETLKALQGRYVTVKCRIDQKNSAIRVLYIIEPSETKHANWGDSAFRR